WLYRIAVNRTLDFLNARKTQMAMKESYEIVDNPEPGEGTQVQLPATGPGPERLLLSAEMKHKIAGAMGLLTPAERVAFTMRHMEGRSIEEISQALNLKVNAAKNSVFRAVQKLRQQLAPYAGPGSTQPVRLGGSAMK
ncbi:MAG TPA: RNA polymerase sigma factor, partial [Candidatus Angelobacter sp.]|nr:RNA polymerase sigma factor [Candidatus Angelobacter sp.]